MKHDRLLLVLTGALALASCIDDPLSRYYPTESQRYLRDAVGPRYQATMPPLYCYATIADPDCYTVPVPGWEHRLIAQNGLRPH